MTSLLTVSLAQTPTPLQHLDRLSDLWGGPQIWVKRDDLTGFGLSGNKVRKLEFHLGAALAAGADTVVTAGAIQSNHCRATALAAAQLGLRCALVLRTRTGEPPEIVRGNHVLHRLSGAALHFVDPDGYRNRDGVMAEIAQVEAGSGHRVWVIPEGASDALGMLGMAAGFDELNGADISGPVRAVWHASSSAGTTAGFGWSASRSGPDLPIVAVSVGDTASRLEQAVAGLWADAAEAYGGALPEARIEYRDDYVGAGYGRVDDAQPEIVNAATAATGLPFDPTYTGKALYGLYREVQSGRWTPNEHVIFWHTGGGFEAL